MAVQCHKQWVQHQELIHDVHLAEDLLHFDYSHDHDITHIIHINVKLETFS